MAKDFKVELFEQLSMLKNRIKLFDQGERFEAKQIATSLRVLFYSSGKKSISVLSHLKFEDRIQLFSSIAGPEDPKGQLIHKVAVPVLIHCNPHFENYGQAEVSKLNFRAPEQIADHQIIPFRTWWSDEVLMAGKSVQTTREKLVSSTADKDGGAHVDAKDNDQLDMMKGGLGNYSFEGPMSELVDVHLDLLRTLAVEVLCSPEIFALADVNQNEFIREAGLGSQK